MNRLLKKHFVCFDGLSMNGVLPMTSWITLFALSLSKGKRTFFRQSVKRRTTSVVAFLTLALSSKRNTSRCARPSSRKR